MAGPENGDHFNGDLSSGDVTASESPAKPDVEAGHGTDVVRHPPETAFIRSPRGRCCECLVWRLEVYIIGTFISVRGRPLDASPTRMQMGTWEASCTPVTAI